MKSYKAYAKVNIFLKITGRREDGYHTLSSRFVRVDSLWDELWFKKKPAASGSFEIEGAFDCPVQSNTIYKAYKELLKYTASQELERFFASHRVCVHKSIPSFAGLGGGSSDAATFLQMCNEELGLGLEVSQLADIGTRVGADVPFFVYGFPSANVSGIGEVVTPFDETPPKLELFTPDVKISTPAVFKEYSKNFYAPISKEEVKRLEGLDSKRVAQLLDIHEANDLYAPACALYEELAEHAAEGWFFSGSGSTFFKLL